MFGVWSCHATASPSNGLQKLTSHETTLGKCLLEGKKVSLQQQDSSCLVFKNVSSSIYCTDRFQASDPLLFDEGLREPALPFHLQTFRGWTLGGDNLPFSSSSSLCPRCCQSSRAIIPGSIAECFESTDSSDDSTDSPCASTLYPKSSQRIWSEISCLQSTEICISKSPLPPFAVVSPALDGLSCKKNLDKSRFRSPVWDEEEHP